MICADNDGAGTISNKIIENAAKTWSLKGHDVYVATPGRINDKKTDFNDVLAQQGVTEVANILHRAELKEYAVTTKKLIASIKGAKLEEKPITYIPAQTAIERPDKAMPAYIDKSFLQTFEMLFKECHTRCKADSKYKTEESSYFYAKHQAVSMAKDIEVIRLHDNKEVTYKDNMDGILYRSIFERDVIQGHLEKYCVSNSSATSNISPETIREQVSDAILKASIAGRLFSEKYTFDEGPKSLRMNYENKFIEQATKELEIYKQDMQEKFGDDRISIAAIQEECQAKFIARYAIEPNDEYQEILQKQAEYMLAEHSKRPNISNDEKYLITNWIAETSEFRAHACKDNIEIEPDRQDMLVHHNIAVQLQEIHAPKTIMTAEEKKQFESMREALDVDKLLDRIDAEYAAKNLEKEQAEPKPKEIELEI